MLILSLMMYANERSVFEAVPGSIYYMHAPPPPPPADHFLGATYFGHPVPPMGIYMPGPDPTALQNQLVKQIEYYFRFGQFKFIGSRIWPSR
jgi:hypothetical protein